MRIDGAPDLTRFSGLVNLHHDRGRPKGFLPRMAQVVANAHRSPASKGNNFVTFLMRRIAGIIANMATKQRIP
jgi:hypothetical protein